MKFIILSALTVFSIVPQSSFAVSEATVYSQKFTVTSLNSVLKCSKSDPNSRSHGAIFHSVYSVETLIPYLEDESEAKLVSNTYNGLSGSASSRGCNPGADEKGTLKQEMTLTLTDYGSLIYREHLYLKAFGEELYGYDKREILNDHSDLETIQRIIEDSRPGVPTQLFEDNTHTVKVITSSANAEGMCQKTIVTQNKRSKNKIEIIIMPLSKVACGQ